MELFTDTSPLHIFQNEHNASTLAKEEIAEHIRQFGGSASISLFDPACSIFSTPHIDGVIGYRIESQCAVVFGDPVCSLHDRARLAIAFHDFCKKKRLSIVYVTASSDFARWAIQNDCGSYVDIGDELVIDPYNDPKQGSKGRLLRGKVNQATRAGITVHEYVGHDPLLQQKLESVAKAWLDARHGPQIYLAQVDLFSVQTGKRWFYAKHNEEVIGVVLLNELKAKEGWLMQLLMVKPNVTNGTSEMLITETLATLKREGCHFMTFGVAQKEELGAMMGFGKMSIWLARLGFKAAKKVFPLDGRRKYWKKFHPELESSFLVFSKGRISLRQIRSLLKALNVSF